MTTASLLDPAAFDMPRDVLWLSHCKDGPLPRASADAVQALMGVQLRPWELRWEEDFLDVQRRLRHAAATLLAADAEDISLMTCTSSGLEAVAFGYPWQAGDEILIPAGEFPSNRLPWLALSRRGVQCREIDLWQPGQRPTARDAPEDRLIEAITPRTRMIAASWVRFQDGIKLDLQKLGAACRGAGVDLVVDAIQGAGTTTLELTGVSALATGGHKGLLGLQGQGFLWTESGFRQKLVPLGTWLSGPEEFSQTSDPAPAADLWATDGRRLEAGSPSILSCEALASSLQLLLDCGGVAAIQAHVASLQRQLLEQLALGDGTWRAEAARLMALLEQDRLGPTLCFALPEERLARLLATAEAQGIHSSVRLGYLRVALHCWHDAEDVRRCVAWLLGTLD